jgi:2'-5' RNA ligase
MARIFAAILLPVEVQAHLDEYVDALRSARPDLRWSPPARWHITMQFLGECGPHEVDRQFDRWQRRARRGRPMRLNLEGAGTFPKAFIARALWTGLGGELDAWKRVAAYDQQPHVTLARTRERSDLTGVVDELSGYVGPSWAATQVAVVESHLRGAGDGGPRYEPLEFFPLGG